MFIGHFGLAFAAKRFAPKTSLPALVFAAEFVDVLWPILLIAGLEHVRIVPNKSPVTPLEFYDYPWSHSLLMGFLWAVGFAAIYFAARRYRLGAITCGILVLSHWLLDFTVHLPDLPLTPLSHNYHGLSLWQSRTLTALVELPIFFVGVWLYSSTTRPRDPKGTWSYWSFVSFLVLVYFINIQGNPPPSVPVLQWSALLGTVVLLLWAWWADRHRELREPS